MSGCTGRTVPIFAGVEPVAIEQTLNRADAAVDAGEGLGGTGFWKAVSEVKRSPELVDRFADRIAEIDRKAHSQWALLVLPLWLGTSIAVAVSLGGLGLVWWAYYLDGLTASVVFLVGTGMLVGSTHGLGHLVVGRIVGIRFTSWFVAGVKRPQPGVKVDYSTYLRTPPRRRAWMHAAGALTTKLIPILLIGAAVAADLQTWAIVAIVVLAVVQVVTDVLWSTKAADWKKFKREMNFAQES